MNCERVGDIVLHGNDAIRFAYMLYHPTEEELLYNRSVLDTQKTPIYEKTTSDGMSLVAA